MHSLQSSCESELQSATLSVHGGFYCCPVFSHGRPINACCTCEVSPVLSFCVVLLLDGYVSEWFVVVARIESDRNGSYISVECGGVSGQLYIDQLPKERVKRVGQCVLSASKKIIPEFERLGGKSAKEWKSLLSHSGHPLSDYNLVCSSAETPSVPITSC